MKKEIRPLTEPELLKRKEYCLQNNLCFITKEPLNKEFYAEFHSSLLGLVKINQHRLPR